MELPRGSNLQRAYRLAVAMSVSPLVTVLFSAIVGEVLRRVEMPEDGFLPLPGGAAIVLRLAAWGTAIAGLFFVGWLRRRLLEGRLSIARMAFFSQSYPEPIRRLATSTLALWFCEVPGILAFVLFLGTGKALDLYPPLALVVVTGVIYFPRYDEWKRWLQEHAHPVE